MKAIVYRVGEKPLEIEAESMLEFGCRSVDMTWLRKTIGCNYVQMFLLGEGELWVDQNMCRKADGELNEFATERFSKWAFPGDSIMGTAVLTLHNLYPGVPVFPETPRKPTAQRV